MGLFAAASVGAWCGSHAANELRMPRPSLDWKTFSALVAALIALLAVLPSTAEFLNHQFIAASDCNAAVRERARANWFGGALILYVVLLTLSAASGFVIGAAPHRRAFVLGFAPLWIILTALSLGLAQDCSSIGDAIGATTSGAR